MTKPSAHNNHSLEKHSVTLSGHATSISIEGVFWNVLKQIAKDRRISLSALINEIDHDRAGNLSSALRVYVVNHLLIQGDNQL